MISKKSIKDALDLGDKDGYELFGEIRHKENIEKIKNIPFINEMASEVKAYALEALTEPSPEITFDMFMEYTKSGNRLKYESAYFYRRKQLFSLVIAYILENDEKYIPVIEEKLWEWCNLYTWEFPAHIPMSVEEIKSTGYEPDETVALFSAETAFFFAEIISIIGDKLNTILAYRLKKEIFRRIITPYKEKSFWWENVNMNWASVCGGSVGATSIYLVENNEELAEILERVLKTMDSFIEGFDKDGITTEGLGYWSYGFGFYVYFAEILKERTNGKINLFTHDEKIKKIAEIPTYLQFPSENFVNFSDAGDKKWRGDCGLFTKLSKELNIHDYNYPQSGDIFLDHTFKWATISRRIFWALDISNRTENKDKTGTFFFPESQWLVDRHINKDNNKFIAFAAKGGNNGEPHNHNDLGHFILHYDWNSVLMDIGSPEYVKEYFRDETRYNYLASSALGHSVPAINGCIQKEGKEHYAEVISCEDTQDKVIYKLNLKNAYDCKNLKKFDREFIWDYSNLELEVKDNFIFDKGSNSIKEAFIVDVEPKLEDDGRVLVCKGNIVLHLEFDKDLKGQIEKETYNDHFGRDAFIYRIGFLAENIGNEKEMIFKIKIEE